MKRLLIVFLLMAGVTQAGETLKDFQPGALWQDNKGVHINAHGGGILLHNGVYYWFGEHKIGGDAGNVAHVGVHVYSSTDLYNWKDEGIALSVSDDPKSDIVKGSVIERPKVIYNAKTGRFVMWFHLELKGKGYLAARSGLAVADKPTGPYTFVRSLRPDAGVWPINVTEEQKAGLKEAEKLAGSTFSGGPNKETPKHNIMARDFAGGQMARDMNLFVDDDGKAYHVFASEENSTLHISLLSDDYQSHAGKWVRLFEHRWNEAPALFKQGGRYWLISSGCTGWDPNAARLAVADSIWGPWTDLGNPCAGSEQQKKNTFESQSTYVLPVAGKPGAFIFMADRWRPAHAIDGRYIWLPIQFKNGQPVIEWQERWDLNVFR
jgi:beta-xylosidase